MKDQPASLGEHLRNRRLALGLRQEDVAGQLGTVREVYDRWERNEREPVVSVWPLILEFLGYYPCPQTSPADLTLMVRRTLGLEQKKLAQRMGVIHQRLRRWEHGSEVPSPSEYSRIQTLLSEAPGVAC
jgi:transcriptional regulator with XRE-family HTH domain